LRRELLDQRDEREVEADDAVAGVVHDVDQLVVEQPRIDRVDHGAHPGHRVVELEMPVAVPRQRAHTVAVADAAPPQGVGELACARVGIAVRVAVDRALDRPRDDLGVAMTAVGVADDRGDHQGPAHHQALHGFLPVGLPLVVEASALLDAQQG
jgi:hypothetical protein